MIGVIFFVILILKNISFEISKEEKPQALFFWFIVSRLKLQYIKITSAVFCHY